MLIKPFTSHLKMKKGRHLCYANKRKNLDIRVNVQKHKPYSVITYLAVTNTLRKE